MVGFGAIVSFPRIKALTLDSIIEVRRVLRFDPLLRYKPLRKILRYDSIPLLSDIATVPVPQDEVTHGGSSE